MTDDPLDPQRFIERAERHETEALHLDRAAEAALDGGHHETAAELIDLASEERNRAIRYRRAAKVVREVRQ